jgi:outer membrane lipopolysaccharide assembly protein LptE/RlpB
MIVLLLFAAGCGYRLSGASHSGARTIAVPVFANKTLRPNAEYCLTTNIVDFLAKSTGGKVVPRDEADLELTGTVLTLNDDAVAFTASDMVAMYRLTMTAEAALRERKSGETVWKGIVRGGTDYSTNKDLALKLNAQDAALHDLCRKLAEDIVRQSGSTF